MEEQKCRVCGCTDDDGCEEGCSWVEDELCSSCAPRIEQTGKGGGVERWYVYSFAAPIGPNKRNPGPDYVFDVKVSRTALHRARAWESNDTAMVVYCRGLKKGQ